MHVAKESSICSVISEVYFCSQCIHWFYMSLFNIKNTYEYSATQVLHTHVHTCTSMFLFSDTYFSPPSHSPTLWFSDPLTHQSSNSEIFSVFSLANAHQTIHLTVWIRKMAEMLSWLRPGEDFHFDSSPVPCVLLLIFLDWFSFAINTIRTWWSLHSLLLDSMPHFLHHCP